MPEKYIKVKGCVENKRKVGSIRGKICRRKGLKKIKSCECDKEIKFGAFGRIIH